MAPVIDLMEALKRSLAEKRTAPAAPAQQPPAAAAVSPGKKPPARAVQPVAAPKREKKKLAG
jgi:hypothetical protein